MKINVIAGNFFLGFHVDTNDSNRIVFGDIAKKDFKDNEMPYILDISEASRRIRDEVLRNAVPVIQPLDEDSLISQVLDTDLQTAHNGIFTLFQAVTLEMYTLEYILATDKNYIISLKKEDLHNLRTNLRFLSCWLADYRKYRFLIQYLREIDISIGYTENQINYILQSTNLAESRYTLNY